MVTVPLQIMDSVGRFSKYSCHQAATILWYDQCVQKGHRTINLGVFYSELYAHITKSGIIYRYRCDRMECEEYIGESSRTFGERFKEHLKVPSPIFDYFNITGHNTTLENSIIVGERTKTL